jgi:hypothetical protein
MKTDREKNGFKGPVHTVRTEIEVSPSRAYRVNPGGLELLEIFTSEYDGQRNLYELFTFDESGRLLEEASSERSLIEQESFRFVYTYDDAGRIARRDEYDQAGSADGKTLYSYDSEGRKVEETYYSAKGNGTRHTKYDQRGNAVEMICYGPDEEITSKNTWESSYNISGNRVEVITIYKMEPAQLTPGTDYYVPYLGWSEEQPVGQSHNSQIPQKYRRVTISDDAGNVVEEIDYDTDGSVFEREVFNITGQVIERYFARAREVFTYNDQGQLIESIRTGPTNEFCANPIIGKYTYRYDLRGKMIECVALDSDGLLDSKETYEYEYDSFDNWVTKIETHLNNKWRTDPEQIAFEWRHIYYRTITYAEEEDDERS